MLSYLWLCKNNHTDQMKSDVGTEGDISQELRGLWVRKILLYIKPMGIVIYAKQGIYYSFTYIVEYLVCQGQMVIKTHLQCWGWWGCISQYLAYVHYRHLDPPPLLVLDVWPLTPELFSVTWTDLKLKRTMELINFTELLIL